MQLRGNRRLAAGWAAALLGLPACWPGDPSPEAGAEPLDVGGSGVPADASSTGGGAPTLDCRGTSLRVATFNIERVSATGSDPHSGLAASLLRIGADVACIQEVHETESAELHALAHAVGYHTVVEANRSPAIGGEIRNACLARIPLARVASYTGSSLSSDPSANDVGRDILAVRAEPAPGCSVALFTVHFKAGGSYEDRFRRQVEAVRLARAVQTYRTSRPDDEVIVMGDFNEELDDPALGRWLETVPESLPRSYSLGSDIELPLRDHPFAGLTDQGFSAVSAFHEDSTEDGTFVGSSQARLDYIFVREVQLDGAEVYNSCVDNGVDDAPSGGWLAKFGAPLSCSASQVASDHLAVFADLTL